MTFKKFVIISSTAAILLNILLSAVGNAVDDARASIDRKQARIINVH